MTKRIMRALKMTAIAAVDSPAQKGARMAIMKRDATPDFDDAAYEKLAKRTFTAEERRHAESTGAAMPGGRYPIESVADLENAIHAVGRGKGSHAAIRRHIMSRARALGATDKIPDDWKASKADLSHLRNAIRKSMPGAEMRVVRGFAQAIAKDAIDGDPEDATLFDDVHEETEAKEYADGMMDEFREAYVDLCNSVASILNDDEVADKAEMLDTTFQQFKNHIQGVVPEEMEKAISRLLTPDLGGSASMKAIAKALELAETATEAEITAALAKSLALAKMSGKHKAFMEHKDAKMPKGGKEAFANMTPAERDDHMKENPIKAEDDGEDDEEVEKSIKKGLAFRTEDGAVLRKADFGTESAFQFAKKAAETMAKQAEEIAKAEDRRQKGEFVKRAEPLNGIGTAEEVGTVLHQVAKADPKLAEQVEALFKTANERIAKGLLTKEIGTGQRPATFGKAAEGIETVARELMAKDSKLTIFKARMKAREKRPDLAEQEREESKPAA